MILNVQFTWRTEGGVNGREVLDIRAYHSYRDEKGRLVTPSHERQVVMPAPQSAGEGLRRGIYALHRLLVDRDDPFRVPATADPEEAAWRLVG